MFIVYCHTNLFTKKRYIGWAVIKLGQTPEQAMIRRWKDHCREVDHGSSCIFHNSIRKYGIDAWEHVVLEVHDTIDDVKSAEVRLIAEFQTFFFDHPDLGYNMTEGGDGVRCVGRANHFFGRKHSEKTREIIRHKRAKQIMNALSTETKEKIRIANLNTFAKLRLEGKTTIRAQNVWKSRKANRVVDNRPVLQCNEDWTVIARHASIIDALKAISRPISKYNGSIKKCCEGIYNRAYGFRWKWENDTMHS